MFEHLAAILGVGGFPVDQTAAHSAIRARLSLLRVLRRELPVNNDVAGWLIEEV